MASRSRPLTSYEVIVETITTTTGLTVQAELDTNIYPTGIKVPDIAMKALEENGAVTRHKFRPEWNYTLNPAPNNETD